VIDQDNEPWFVAKDVCDVLELKNPRTSIASLDEDEKNTVRIMDGTPGNPETTVVNEHGLYSLILRSRKPQAKAFKRWVTITKGKVFNETKGLWAVTEPGCRRKRWGTYCGPHRSKASNHGR